MNRLIPMNALPVTLSNEIVTLEPIALKHTADIVESIDADVFKYMPMRSSVITNDFNGEIRPGRFGAQWFGNGTFIGDAYLNFTVDTAPVPAPGSASLLLGAGLIATRRRR